MTRIPSTTGVNQRNGRLQLIAMEPRMLFDGALAVAGDEAMAASAANDSVDEQPREVVFIDAAVSEIEDWLRPGPGALVVQLQAGRDGVEQMAEFLRGLHDIQAVHIVSHGSQGRLMLGDAVLDTSSTQGQHADDLATIGSALSANADILLYGCNVGSQPGMAFIDSLAVATGADVRASSNETGAASLGGDWMLEVGVGAVETRSLDAFEWDGVLTLPELVDDSVSVDQGSGVSGNVLENDSDADGDRLEVAWISIDGKVYGAGEPVDLAGIGQLTVAADGAFSFTPADGFTGAVPTVSYVVTDPVDGEATGNLSITVNPVVVQSGSAPSATDDYYGVAAYGTLYSGDPGVLGNDYDADGDHLTVVLVSGTYNGSLNLDANGGFSYSTWTSGTTDSFTYYVTDGSYTSNVATVYLSVDSGFVDPPTNNAPTANSDQYSVSAYGSLNAYWPGVLANDWDPEGNSLSVSLYSGPTYGSLSLYGDGTFYYSTGLAGVQDSFSYTVFDGSSWSAPATVYLDVASDSGGYGGGNSSPAANDDYFSVSGYGSIYVGNSGVLGNDYDPEGGALTASLISGPSYGSLTLNADGTFSYSAGYSNQSDQFSYSVSDSYGATASATVYLTIGSANSAPTASDDAYSLHGYGTLFVNGAGVLANDSDPDGGPMTATLTNGPSYGSLSFNADGTFSYYASYSDVTDSFTYMLTDDAGNTSSATVNLYVGSPNQAPAPVADSYQLAAFGTIDIDASAGVLANDSDPNGDRLFAYVYSGPSHGSLTFNADGSFRYEAATSNTVDSFSYYVSDGFETSAEQTVLLSIDSAAPVIQVSALDIQEGGSVVLTAANLSALDSDSTSTDLTFTVANVTGGQFESILTAGVAIQSFTQADVDAGQVRFVHDGGEAAPAFELNIADQQGHRSANVAATVQFANMNDQPLGLADEADGGNGSAVTGNVLENDSDLDGDLLELVEFEVDGQRHAAGATATLTGIGELRMLSTGDYQFTPAAGYSGSVPTVFYTVADANGGSARVSFSISDVVAAAAPEAGAEASPTTPAPTTNDGATGQAASTGSSTGGGAVAHEVASESSPSEPVTSPADASAASQATSTATPTTVFVAPPAMPWIGRLLSATSEFISWRANPTVTVDSDLNRVTVGRPSEMTIRLDDPRSAMPASFDPAGWRDSFSEPAELKVTDPEAVIESDQPIANAPGFLQQLQAEVARRGWVRRGV